MSDAVMIERLRGNHALSWTAIGSAALAGVVACFLPSVELGLTASIGAGNEQRAFHYDRELTLVPGLSPASLLVLGAAVALLGLSLAALRWGSRVWLVLPACAIALLCLRGARDVSDRLQWSDRGVIGYEQPNGGLLLQPALDDLKAAARSSPEAREAGWELSGGEHAYRSRGLTGWLFLERLAIAVAGLTAYRTFRLVFRPSTAVAATCATATVVLVWIVLEGLSGLQ
jgi:hypothetical protein